MPHAVTAVASGAHRHVLGAAGDAAGAAGRQKVGQRSRAAVGVLQAASGGLGLTLWSYLVRGHRAWVGSACVSHGWGRRA